MPDVELDTENDLAKEEPLCDNLLDDLSDIRDDMLEGIYDYEVWLINNAVIECTCCNMSIGEGIWLP